MSEHVLQDVPAQQRVLIFGYNRGRFLENAVVSALRHIPDAAVTVIDDHSDDAETLHILDGIRERIEVLRPSRGDVNDRVTGGLHHAMNFAFDHCEGRGEDIVLVLQDDMQVVRDVRRHEISEMASFFRLPSASFVLGCGFTKTYRGTRNAQMHRVGNFYFRDSNAIGVATTYTDTGLFSIKRLRETIGHLTTGEASNQARSAEAGLRLGMTTMPVVSFLPFPISYRKRKRAWGSEILDRVSGAGVHPITPLAGEKLATFLARDPDVLPFDEDWLTAPTAPPCHYWSYSGGKSNARARGGWRRLLAEFL